MSEPMGVEERARLREWAEAQGPEHPLGSTVTALLDEVDRLDLLIRQGAAKGMCPDLITHVQRVQRIVAESEAATERAERAEADLADEKRRRAEQLAAVWDECHESGTPWDNPYRALLDTATEETP